MRRRRQGKVVELGRRQRPGAVGIERAAHLHPHAGHHVGDAAFLVDGGGAQAEQFAAPAEAEGPARRVDGGRILADGAQAQRARPAGEAANLRASGTRARPGSQGAGLHVGVQPVHDVREGDVHRHDAADLAAELGARAIFLAESSGGEAFDEAHTTPWAALAARFSHHPIPQACLATTLEFRGRADVSDDLASSDAEKIVHFLMRRGIVMGTPGRLPDPLAEATELTALDSVLAPSTGLVVFKVALGDQVKAGDVVAEIIDPAIPDPVKARTPVTTRATGLVLTMRDDPYLRMGDIIAYVVGTEPLPRRSASLLND